MKKQEASVYTQMVRLQKEWKKQKEKAEFWRLNGETEKALNANEKAEELKALVINLKNLGGVE